MADAREVITEVKRIRAKRIAEAPHPIPPPGLTEAQERAWIGEARRRIGNGEAVDPSAGRELVERNVSGLRALIGPRPSGKHAPAPLLDPSDHTREPTPPAPDETTDQPKEGAA